MKITIGGLSGTGTSTVGRALAKQLQYHFISGGNFARQLATARNMTIEEWDKYMFDNNDYSDDEKIDSMQREYGKTNDNFMLESRLGWYNIPDSLKIKLHCDDDVRFQRTAKADPERFGSLVEDFEKTKNKSLEREETHRQRIKKIYGIENLNDDSHYDYIIDTSNINIEQVLEKCLEIIKSYGRKEN
jgi:cytidylate kinase